VMKIHKYHQTFLSLLAVTALAVPALSAQTNSTNTPPPPPPPDEHRGGPMERLTPAEMAQLKAAHDKAIAQDPSLEQNMKAAHEAMEKARMSMHDAILKADPSIAPILEKITPPKWGHEMRHPEGFGQTNRPGTNSATMTDSKHEKHGMPPGFANLTPAEKLRLKAAHEAAKNDPAVVSAKQAAKNATTPQDRHAAREACRKAMHDAMIKADPTIEPLLEKVAPPKGGEGGEGEQGAPGNNEGGAGAPMPPPPQ
jgi:hypothetical protein